MVEQGLVLRFHSSKYLMVFFFLCSATCYGGACVGEWSTETTKYKTLNFKEDSYVHVSCKYSHLKVEGEEETIKCVGGQLPTYLPQCVLREGKYAW
ncbi:hypothetical protein AVEN_194754-1 [Araneus ventricosus]|uniref:Uncharacterized protein n=1 Tax=Araneus ventricosus TaxID=182803 RepID=A0A4Y2B2C3_ARAVE|nr:hypothetical protein AVEN_194754-1 [Araneus ventricosus]